MSLPVFHYSNTFGSSFPWGDSIPFGEGEKPINWVENAIRVGFANPSTQGKAYLVLTSRRILYVFVTAGQAQMLWEIDLENVMLVGFSEHRTLRLLEKGGEYVELASQDQARLEEMIPLINGAVGARRVDISTHREAEMHPGNDFSKLVRQMERAGLVVSNLKCLSCGSPMVIPPSGTSSECTYCGTTLYTAEMIARLRESLA